MKGKLVWLLYAMNLSVVQILTWIITPLLPMFAVYRFGYSDNGINFNTGPRLPKWLSWFDTPDNSLLGDWRWKAKGPDSYWKRVAWLYRNSLYGYKWSVLSLPAGSDLAWQYRRYGKYLWIDLGWLLTNPTNDVYLYQFSIRKSKGS